LAISTAATLGTLKRQSPDQDPRQVIHGSKVSGPSENDLDDKPKKEGLGNVGSIETSAYNFIKRIFSGIGGIGRRD
jgi:hypothetical protein